MIKLKRAYDISGKSDGYRILVDRLWPRGVSKEKAEIDEWIKEIAPTDKLRKWFAHDETKWDEFKRRYFDELKTKEVLILGITEKLTNHTVTFVYAAKDEDHNNAVALKEYIEKNK